MSSMPLSRALRAASTLAAGLLLSLSAAAQSAWIQGEVRKIDKPVQKITLRHEEMRHLDMPPMTMVFRVQDVDWLEPLKVGDRVRFKAEKLEGQFTVTAIEPAR